VNLGVVLLDEVVGEERWTSTGTCHGCDSETVLEGLSEESRLLEEFGEGLDITI
jgi:hypothetical protein